MNKCGGPQPGLCRVSIYFSGLSRRHRQLLCDVNLGVKRALSKFRVISINPKKLPIEQ